MINSFEYKKKTENKNTRNRRKYFNFYYQLIHFELSTSFICSSMMSCHQHVESIGTSILPNEYYNIHQRLKNIIYF